MTVIRRAESRRTETPNAVMTTLASPEQGGAGQAVWRVEMQPGHAGPLHAIDTEQVWTVLEGAATIELGAEKHVVEAGDTVVMPAGEPRRIATEASAGFTAVVAAPAGLTARPLPDGDPVVPAWVV